MKTNPSGRITDHGSRITLLVLALAGMIGAAQGADYPTKPVRMVVPIGPGSSMDITGRVVAQRMNETWGQPAKVVLD